MITCIFEDGNHVHLRHVVVHAIIVKDNKILLGKRGTFQGRPILESGKWGLTAGYMDRDENLLGTIKRETKEETGLDIVGTTLLRINSNPNRPQEDRQNVAFVFIAEAEGELKTVSEEVTELKWFDLENLPPDEEIAFDHKDDIALYKEYKQGKTQIPVLV